MQKLVTLLILILFSTVQFVTSQIYVDATALGNNDGTSWADAYVLLDSALVNAVSNDSVVVAEGNYRPHIGVDFDASGDTSRKEATFNIPDGVGVYGGFPSGGGERNISDHPTVLSGVNLSTLSDTSYHVVYFREVSNTTRLDGFTIQKGKTASYDMVGSITDSIGGGGILNAVYSSSASSDPVIANCTFNGNMAFIGGGFCNYIDGGQSNTVLENCNFTGNSAFFSGGYANFSYNEATINSEMTECTFNTNDATEGGGGMGNISMGSESNCTLNSCTFRGNISGSDGGGFTNSAGPFFDGTGNGINNVVMNNCTFIDNSSGSGGGMEDYVDMNGTSTTIMTECVFEGNVAKDIDYSSAGGYKVSCDSAGVSSITMKRCIFSNDSVMANNWASGGGMKVSCYPFAEMHVNLDSCRFSSNFSSHGEGGLAVSVDSTCTADLIVTNCEFIENTAQNSGGGGMGTSSHMSGALVQELYNCKFTDNVSGGDGGGLNISSERGEISPVIDSCVFTGNIAESSGGGLYNACWGKGSGEAGENTPLISNCTFEEDTSRNASGGALYNYYSDASITNSLFRNNAGQSGGAIGNNHSNIAFFNCSVIGNHATAGNGGAISNYESNPEFTDCILNENDAFHSGGCMFNNNSSPIIDNCTLSGNAAREEGGGIVNFANNGESSPEIISTIISGNSATLSGGGVYNQAGINGFTNPVIVNTTISGNTAGDRAGGLYNRSNSGNCNPEFLNSIIWGNSQVGGQVLNENAIPAYAYSDVEGSGGSEDWKTSFGVDNGNNIDTLAHFVNMPDTTDAPTEEGDLSLLLGSPCIDAGDFNTPDSLLTEYDNAGNVRIFNDNIDMGAYEYSSIPEVLAAIEDVVVDEDAPDTTVTDLNEVFEDPEQGSALAFSVVSNSNEDLLSATINSDDSTLVLSFNADSNGVAEIIVGAENQYSYIIKDTFNVTVNPVNDPLVASDNTWSIPEDAENSTNVGTVTATDVDNGSLTYSIQSGNDDGIFDIMAGTGTISVVDNTNLDYETTTSYDLEVMVSDGEDSDIAQITINVTDVDETPDGVELTDADSEMLLYPNPSTGFITLETEHTGPFSVIDMDGRKVTQLQAGKNDISELKPGMYYIIINLENRDNTAISFLKK